MINNPLITIIKITIIHYIPLVLAGFVAVTPRPQSILSLFQGITGGIAPWSKHKNGGIGMGQIHGKVHGKSWKMVVKSGKHGDFMVILTVCIQQMVI